MGFVSYIQQKLFQRGAEMSDFFARVCLVENNGGV